MRHRKTGCFRVKPRRHTNRLSSLPSLVTQEVGGVRAKGRVFYIFGVVRGGLSTDFRRVYNG
jgi:hypothetical protein